MNELTQEIAQTISQIRFNDSGLVPAIAQDSKDGTILMVAWMNRASLAQTLETGFMVFWSRSRKELWKKGETSGNILKVESWSPDCDSDTLLFKVQILGNGVACHTGERSCFHRYTSIPK